MCQEQVYPRECRRASPRVDATALESDAGMAALKGRSIRFLPVSKGIGNPSLFVLHPTVYAPASVDRARRIVRLRTAKPVTGSSCQAAKR